MILFISWIYRYVKRDVFYFKLVDLKNYIQLAYQQNPRKSSVFYQSFGSDWLSSSSSILENEHSPS